MSKAELSIIDEVESAIRMGSPEKGLETARRVTDLFLSSAASFDDEQIALFDDVLERLIGTIELRAVADIGARIALAEISAQLAPIAQAPPSVIRRLASNDEIRIAGPVLQESARLDDGELVKIASSKGEPHLLAVAGRWWLREIVTDALLARRYPSVSRRLAANPGARVSGSGFAIIVGQAESDPELAVSVGVRVDLPSELRRRLLRSATDAVRTRLLSRAPPHLFEEIQSAIAAATVGVEREMSGVRDFEGAKRAIANLKTIGQLNEATLLGFATQRRYEETVAALAALSGSTVEVIRPLMQSLRDDGLLVPCKAAQLSWETTAAVLESRFATGAMKRADLARSQGHFARMTTENARRTLRFWQVRAL
ncbi:DUF2336 domain-containing protein [Bradyrhizobium sp. 180]|uniref:DUF2336 domain-containing protein n=1 Tax=unclassified Bradyrhizobium TaxID=2631580 RepID=UPI001FFB2E0C|nr:MULTISPECIES: DUF2336 domain-containing protein [unclassified Bradyrhizobium]MCK1424938.1 DUF2336 domain-containing protein [Bradyrhizobium sp. CW12]MCK1494836.1 DUF2336 domain-containing protein [Bradyrhizobium sp. 180]MCK1530396.1 DUF2336 domain-containing protein [Bradyrhizobium sp. 182]MCK1595950.1 DUF2336 domain-containing protein [Bradyrhizobium sp. 164]MCK1621259.1 DUF2336 domain-containing protein [Bradyrhizobium sp. 159]